MQSSQREHFWNTLIWPFLGPLLAVQATLVVLCVLVAWLSGGMSPGDGSWHAALWLMLALLVGSCLNVAVFLMLVKSRASAKEARLMEQVVELERNAQAISQQVEAAMPPAGHEVSARRPFERIANVNRVLSSLPASVGAYLASPVDVGNDAGAQLLRNDLHDQQQQIKRLLSERDRAREESRLKSEYLGLLQRETNGVYTRISEQLTTSASQESRAGLLEVSERIADIRTLLMSLAQDQNARVVPCAKAPVAPVVRVLVVDDGPVNLMLARQMLEDHGLQVEGVTSGVQALERQKHSGFDLVFMDIFMPNLNGLETARRWREAEATQKDHRCVLIALTANIDSTGPSECLSAGLDDLLTKPYQPSDLLAMVAKWFPDSPRVSSDP